MSPSPQDLPPSQPAGDTPRLLIATTNPGKVREFRRMLAGSGFELTTPAECGLDLTVDESGDTYETNATLKAVAYARASGLLALADDSGIEADALGGRPGVYSARYGGPGLGDEGRTALLLQELAAIPHAPRTGRYVAVIAIADPGSSPGEPAVELFRGVQEGHIGNEPRGENGFGYDPVFLVDGHTTQAELSEAAKDRISHRGKALRAARAYLQGRPPC